MDEDEQGLHDEAFRIMETMQDWFTTAERKYFKSKMFFGKRALRPSEYHTGMYGIIVPRLGVERLKNEADCLLYLRKNTNIPVPEVKYAFEADDVFYLIMTYEDGPTLCSIAEEEKAYYLEELLGYLDDLHKLRSTTIGGPGAVVVPPLRVLSMTLKEGLSFTPPKTLQSEDFVFCHNDISEHNVIVDRENRRIKAVIDWECSGFWPLFFEAPVYTRKGLRKSHLSDSPSNVERMENFLRSYCANEGHTAT